jgi:hypothetical protein
MTFTTKIKAYDPKDCQIKTWSGPRIQAISWAEAEHICAETMPYAWVDGLLWAEIDEETGKKDNFLYWN